MTGGPPDSIPTIKTPPSAVQLHRPACKLPMLIRLRFDGDAPGDDTEAESYHTNEAEGAPKLYEAVNGPEIENIGEVVYLAGIPVLRAPHLRE